MNKKKRRRIKLMSDRDKSPSPTSGIKGGGPIATVSLQMEVDESSNPYSPSPAATCRKNAHQSLSLRTLCLEPSYGYSKGDDAKVSNGLKIFPTRQSQADGEDAFHVFLNEQVKNTFQRATEHARTRESSEESAGEVPSPAAKAPARPVPAKAPSRSGLVALTAACSLAGGIVFGTYLVVDRQQSLAKRWNSWKQGFYATDFAVAESQRDIKAPNPGALLNQPKVARPLAEPKAPTPAKQAPVIATSIEVTAETPNMGAESDPIPDKETSPVTLNEPREMVHPVEQTPNQTKLEHLFAKSLEIKQVPANAAQADHPEILLLRTSPNKELAPGKSQSQQIPSGIVKESLSKEKEMIGIANEDQEKRVVEKDIAIDANLTSVNDKLPGNKEIAQTGELTSPKPKSGKDRVMSPLVFRRKMAIEDIRVRNQEQKYQVRFSVRNLSREKKTGHVYAVATIRMPDGSVIRRPSPAGLKLDENGQIVNPQDGVSFDISTLVYKKLEFDDVPGEIVGLTLSAHSSDGQLTSLSLQQRM